jgi:hypothetical protein
MYHSRIEAAPPVAVADQPSTPGAVTTVTGLAVLAVGLPLIAARLLVYGIGRSLAKIGTLAGIVGTAAIEAARSR